MMQNLATPDIIMALMKTFIFILPGYIIGRLGIIGKHHTEGISALITCVCYPCLVISAMQMEFSMRVLNNCKYTVLIFMSASIIAILISRVVVRIRRLPPRQAGIYSFMMIFGNTGFIGLPVMSALFGSEAVFYGALCDSSYDIFMFTIGITLVRNAAAGEGDRPSLLQTAKGLLNPCFIGVLIGMTFFLLRIDLPDMLMEPVERIGSMTSPLAMIVVGAALSRVRMKNIFGCGAAYEVCVVKLLILPLIVLGIVKLTIGTGSLLASVIVMQSAMPCAMFSVILSERYDGDVDLASAGVMMTTLLCIFTIPLHAILLQYV